MKSYTLLLIEYKTVRNFEELS